MYQTIYEMEELAKLKYNELLEEAERTRVLRLSSQGTSEAGLLPFSRVLGPLKRGVATAAYNSMLFLTRKGRA